MSSSEGSYTPFGSQSSLEGSYTPFQSPNSSLANLEFEFTGFESTLGISGLPFIDHLNNQITTMTPTGTMPPTEEPQASEGWKKFQFYAQATLRAISKEVTALSTTLQEPTLNQSAAQINAHTYRTTRFRHKLQMLEDKIEEVAYDETIPESQLDKLNDDITALSVDIDVQHAVIEELIAQAKEKASETNAVANALRQVANTPTVDLPTFDGKTIDYQAFKEHFQFVINKVNGPPELNATHLINSLQGPVKQYIGAGNKWFNKYDDLWKLLDSKYDNKYTLNYETLSAFFHKTLQGEQPDPVKNFVYIQLDNISNIKSLGLTAEELCTTYLIEALPTTYKTILKDGLKRTYPDKPKATFSIGEIRKVFNDTIGAIQDDEAIMQGKNLTSFLSHYGQAKEEESDDESEDETAQSPTQLPQSLPQQHPHPQGKISGHQQIFQQPNAMKSQHQVSYSQPMPLCSLCHDQDFPHPTHNCHLFPTPYEKRTQLTQLGKCPSCTREQHPQSPCPYYLSCAYHPGVRHYTWLCPEQAATGPL